MGEVDHQSLVRVHRGNRENTHEKSLLFGHPPRTALRGTPRDPVRGRRTRAFHRRKVRRRARGAHGGGARRPPGEVNGAFADPETPEIEIFDSVGVLTTPPIDSRLTRKGANSNSPPPDEASKPPGEPPDERATASKRDASRDDSVEEAAILDRFRAVPPPSPPRRSFPETTGDDERSVAALALCFEPPPSRKTLRLRSPPFLPGCRVPGLTDPFEESEFHSSKNRVAASNDANERTVIALASMASRPCSHSGFL